MKDIPSKSFTVALIIVEVARGSVISCFQEWKLVKRANNPQQFLFRDNNCQYVPTARPNCSLHERLRSNLDGNSSDPGKIIWTPCHLTNNRSFLFLIMSRIPKPPCQQHTLQHCDKCRPNILLLSRGNDRVDCQPPTLRRNVHDDWSNDDDDGWTWGGGGVSETANCHNS